VMARRCCMALHPCSFSMAVVFLVLSVLMMGTDYYVSAQEGIDICNGHVTTVIDNQQYEVIVPPRMEDPNCRGHQLLRNKISGQLYCMAKTVTDPSKCTNLKCTEMPTTLRPTTPTPLPTTPVPTTRRPTTTTQTTTQTTTLPFVYLCGRDNGLVTHGKFTDWDRFPWIVYLQRREEDDPTQGNPPNREDYEYRTMCTGTIVNQHFILVPAHCVYEEKNAPFQQHFDYRIVYDKGANHGAQSKAPHEVFDGIRIPTEQHPFPRKLRDGKNMHVKRIIRHPKYVKSENKPNSKFDMALLELTAPLEYSKFTGPVCMPDFEGKDSEVDQDIEVFGCCGHDAQIRTFNVRIRGDNDGWWNPQVISSEKMDSSWIANSNLLYQRGVIKSKNVCDTRQSDSADTFGVCVIPQGDPVPHKMKCFSAGGGPGARKKDDKWYQVLLGSYTFGHQFRPCTCVCYVEDYSFENQEGLNHAYYQSIDIPEVKDFLHQNKVIWSNIKADYGDYEYWDS